MTKKLAATVDSVSDSFSDSQDETVSVTEHRPQSTSFQFTKPPSFASISRKQTRDKVDANTNFTTSDDENDIVEALAANKANSISLPVGVRSSQDLCWYSHTNEHGCILFPCRICDTSEAIYVKLEPTWDTSEVALVQVLEYPPTNPFAGKRDRILADRSALSTYGTHKNWDTQSWRKYVQQRKRRQALWSESDQRAGYLYLQRILNAATQLEESNKTKEIKHNNQESDSQDDDDSLLEETPYEVALPHAEEPGFFSDKKREPLRPGDVITYCSPIFCAGDPRGKRVATVLETDPGMDFMIRLSNNEALPNLHVVKRIKVLENGKLYKHHGYFRQIQHFVLKKRSFGNLSVKDVLLKQSEALGSVLDAKVAKLNEKAAELGLPTDLIYGFKSRRKIAAERQRQVPSSTSKEVPAGKMQIARVSNKAAEDSESDSLTFDEPKKKCQKIAKSIREDIKDLEDDSSFERFLRKRKRKGDGQSQKNLSRTLSSPPRRMLPETQSDTSEDEIVVHAQKPEHSLPKWRVVDSYPVSKSPNRNGSEKEPTSNAVEAHMMLPLHDESDSDSSMENHGLTLHRDKTSVNVHVKHSSKNDPQKDIPHERCGERKIVSIDNKTERWLSTKHCYLPEMHDRTKDQPRQSFTFSKVNSSKAPSRPVNKALSRRHDVYKLSEKANTENLPASDCIDLTGPSHAEGETVNSSGESHFLRDMNGRLNNTRHLQRIKRKAAFTADEDDIEDSSEGSSCGRFTPKRTKNRSYQPVAMFSSSKKKSRDLELRKLSKRNDYPSDTSDAQESVVDFSERSSSMSKPQRTSIQAAEQSPQDSIRNWQGAEPETARTKQNTCGSATRDRGRNRLPPVVQVGVESSSQVSSLRT